MKKSLNELVAKGVMLVWYYFRSVGLIKKNEIFAMIELSSLFPNCYTSCSTYIIHTFLQFSDISARCVLPKGIAEEVLEKQWEQD